MKKIIINMLFIFLTIFSINTYSADLGVTCGLVDNKVAEQNFEVCQKDESFRMLYELFPKFFDEGVFQLYDFGDIENLKDNPEVSSENQFRKFSDLLYAVFGTLLSVTHYIIAFFLFYYTFFSMLRTAESGDFMDNGKQTIMLSLIYGGVVGFLLLPIAGLTMIQLFILCLSILAISLANFVYGNYLSIYQTDLNLVDMDEEPSYILSEMEDSNTGLMAKSYISDLTKIAVCRDISSQILLEEKVFDLKVDNSHERINCTAGKEHYTDINDYSKTENRPYPSFFNLDYTGFYNGREKTIETSSSLTFGIGVNKIEKRSCSNDNYRAYTCGKIKIKSPKINDAFLVKVYGINNFIMKIKEITDSLSLSGDNYNKIHSNWLSMKSDIETKLLSLKNLNDGSEESKMASDIMLDIDTSSVKALSSIYHQLILNSLTTGIGFKTFLNKKGTADEKEIVNNFDFKNYKALERDWELIKPIARIIEENHCIMNSAGLSASVETLKHLDTLRATVNGSARCINFDERKVYGVVDGSPLLDIVESKLKSAELTKEAIIQFDKVAQDVFKRRKEVEQSFLSSINIESQEQTLNNLRQRGWLTMPTYLMAASQEIKTNNLYIKELFNSNKFAPLQIGEKGAAATLTIGNQNIEKFVPFFDGSNIFQYLVNIESNKSVYFDTESFAMSKIQNDPEGIKNGNFNLNDFLQIIMNPIGPLKEALGIRQVEDFKEIDNSQKSIIELCKNENEICPLPRTDPLIGLSQYGHYLMNVSINYFIIIASFKGLVTVGQGMKSTKTKDAKAGVGSKNKILSNITKKFSSSSGSVGKGLEYFGEFLDLMSEILSSIGYIVIMLFFVGVFLAYIFPLLPMIYFVVGYITWMLLIVQVMIISPVWVAHFIRYRENKEVIVQAAKNYGLQILFKPLFMVLGMIFAWELLKVALFFINLTIFSLFGSISSDGDILSFLQETIFLILLIFILYVVIKFILDMISSITEILLKTLGSEAIQDEQQNMNELLEYYLVGQGLSLSKDGSRFLINDVVGGGLKTPFDKIVKKQQKDAEEYSIKKQIEEKNAKETALQSGKADSDNIIPAEETQLERIERIEKEKTEKRKEIEFIEEEIEVFEKEKEALEKRLENNNDQETIDQINKDIKDIEEKMEDKKEELEKGNE